MIPDSPHAKSSKAKKARASFTDHQVASLERRYKKQRYISPNERLILARSLGLQDQQVKTWFQNRRMKEKRVYADQGLTHAPPMIPGLPYPPLSFLMGAEHLMTSRNPPTGYSPLLMTSPGPLPLSLSPPSGHYPSISGHSVISTPLGSCLSVRSLINNKPLEGFSSKLPPYLPHQTLRSTNGIPPVPPLPQIGSHITQSIPTAEKYKAHMASQVTAPSSGIFSPGRMSSPFMDAQKPQPPSLFKTNSIVF